ncbi:MAG: UMP kinase [Lachnospiraceae bacterium]|nr:UMP kinase [Sarcina sp.]MBR2729610.1 UMP kinase [Lachnospiraceae bacterium]
MSRIILKLSGEALAGEMDGSMRNAKGAVKLYDEETIAGIAAQVKELCEAGHQVGVVTGGGNIWRGRTGDEIDRVKSDQIGMLATVMNCLYVSEIFRRAGLKTRVMTPFICGTFTEQFSKDAAVRYLEEGIVVFFAGGTGHPYFSTDTGIVLRAVEVGADMILMAKNVDGVYDSDPAKNPGAKRFDRLTYEEVVEKDLQAVDMTSSVLAKENGMEMRVFALQAPQSIIRAASGDFDGTTITA